MLNLSGGWRKDASKVYPYGGRFVRSGKAIGENGFYQSMRDRYLEVFKRAASGLRGDNPAELEDDQWWALGRHYGLISPLLDWTEKPYIAAYFALSELYVEMTQKTDTEMDKKGSGMIFEGREVYVYRLFHNE